MPTMSTDIFIWIPRQQTTKYNITINGENVTEFLVNSAFTKATTSQVGNFSLSLENSTDYFTDRYSNGNEVMLYLDFANGDTVRFRGYIESMGSSLVKNYTYDISGRHVAGKLVDRTVTKSFTDTAVSDILTSIITEFAPEFSFDNVDSLSTTLSVNWEGKPFWDCVIDLCNVSKYDCYVDDDSDFHFFNKINNEEEAIVWSDNLVSFDRIGFDSMDIINKVRVQGVKAGLPIIVTVEDLDSQQLSWVKEKVVKISSIDTVEEATELAESLLANQQINGKSVAGILPSLKPADTIWISIPDQQIHNRYKISKFTHRFPSEKTECVIQKESTFETIIKASVDNIVGLEQLDNPNNMEHSINFDFENEVTTNMILNKTVLSDDGWLQIESGESAGDWSNETIDTDEDVSSVEFRIIGQNLQDTTFEVSTDGGNNWDDIVRNTQLSVTVPGKGIKFKVNMNNPSGTTARIDSLAILYK